jgi:hypothetical protein
MLLIATPYHVIDARLRIRPSYQPLAITSHAALSCHAYIPLQLISSMLLIATPIASSRSIVI